MVTVIISILLNTVIMILFINYIINKMIIKNKGLLQVYSKHEYKYPSPYVVCIENTSEKKANAIIFGRNKRLLSDNFGSDESINISNVNGSYLQLLNQSASQPFETNLIRIFSENESQVKNAMSYESSDANGQSCIVPLIIEKYFNPSQAHYNIIDASLELKIDGNTELSYTVNPKTKVTLSFRPQQKINISMALGNNDILYLWNSNLINKFSNKIKSFFKKK